MAKNKNRAARKKEQQRSRNAYQQARKEVRLDFTYAAEPDRLLQCPNCGEWGGVPVHATTNIDPKRYEILEMGITCPACRHSMPVEPRAENTDGREALWIDSGVVDALIKHLQELDAKQPLTPEAISEIVERAAPAASPLVTYLRREPIQAATFGMSFLMLVIAALQLWVTLHPQPIEVAPDVDREQLIQEQIDRVVTELRKARRQVSPDASAGTRGTDGAPRESTAQKDPPER